MDQNPRSPQVSLIFHFFFLLFSLLPIFILSNRSSLLWFRVSSSTTIVPDRSMVIQAEKQLENGEKPNFRRFIGVRVGGGVSDVLENGEVWRSQSIIPVDVTDPTQVFVEPMYLETVRKYNGNLNDNVPSNAPIPETDAGYLILSAMALYGDNPLKGEPRVYLPYCNNDPANVYCSTGGWAGSQKFFVQPYQWLEKKTWQNLWWES
eukprot:Lithocolla_globosa_v1_NODE_475_length_3955_cov_7.586410.p3 type:complete len:206 gc:universal NODE_475_length_3955_cov_7.586410:2956-2339(-)